MKTKTPMDNGMVCFHTEGGARHIKAVLDAIHDLKAEMDSRPSEAEGRIATQFDLAILSLTEAVGDLEKAERLIKAL